MPILVIDVGSENPFEISVRLDILLCYPNWPPQRRKRLADARCRQMVRDWTNLEPDRADEIAGRFPVYANAGPRVSLGTLPKRRQNAQYAGYAFLPLLKYAETGELPRLGGKDLKLSRNAIVEWIWPPAENGDEIEYRERLHNILKRRLRPWDSVAHLAAAFAYVAKERAGDADGAPYDPQDLAFHCDIVVRANRYADHIRASPELKAIARRLIDIEWRE